MKFFSFLGGRFSLRNFGLSQTLITDDPTELGAYIDNKAIEITSIDELTSETILISYIQKRDWIQEHSCSNVGMFKKILLIIFYQFSYLTLYNLCCPTSFIKITPKSSSFAKLCHLIYWWIFSKNIKNKFIYFRH